MAKQRTISTTIQATGIGVHSGERVVLTLRPAPPNTGIVFCRTDLEPIVQIPGRFEFIGDTSLCTCLERGEARIGTVEHLMSSLAGLGIDNVYIDIDGPEIPIMDGSAGPFIFLLQSAGIEEQKALKKFIRIKKRVTVKEGDKVVRVEPFDGFKIGFTINFDHPIISETAQTVMFDFSTTSYLKEIARARTFGFLSDYEYIKKKNLAQGASLDNAIVLDKYKVLNENGLRYRDEFVKHKMLDIIGDLYLLGHSVIGKVTATKSGHALNSKLLMKLMANEDAWEIVTYDDAEKMPLSYIPVVSPAV